MASSDAIIGRLNELESLLTHLQHDVEQLSAVLLEQQGEIESLKRLIDRLESGWNDLLDSKENPPPEDERPPHY